MGSPDFLEKEQISEYELKRKKYAAVRTGEAFLEKLDDLPPSRAVSLAKTKIEEAVMWLNKNIYRNA